MADQPKAQEKQAVEKAIEKFVKPEKREIKEIKEKPEKFEHKEKPEKVEHKEKPEKFEHKEKPEKFEHKEKPEKFEHKELVKEKELVFEKNPPEKFIIENGPNPTNNGGPIEQRVAALEQSVATMNHFITSNQLPDLSRGALSSEPCAKKPGG
jgi:hypothetical protein